jgi:hypothetical protein
MSFEKLKQIRVLFITLIAVLMILAAAGNRAAESSDIKAFPGAMCVEKTPGNDFYHSPFGSLLNAHVDSTLGAVCPIVRDNPTDPYVFVKVVVVDRHSSANITCQVFSNSRSGQTHYSTSVLSSSGDSASPQVLSFDPIPEYDYGSYTIYCVVPPFEDSSSNSGKPSGIGSYLISEP